jgi:hypothetical protein
LHNEKSTTPNITKIFGNTAGPGVFGVGATESNAMDGVAHAGWVLRTVGSGGRAGRVFTETLVAMGSMSSDFEDVVTLDVALAFNTQPAAQSIGTGLPVVFSVVATATPSAVISYQWQESTGGAFTNIVNAGVYTDATTGTLNISNVAGKTGNRYRCVISAPLAINRNSKSATLTVV